MNASVPARMRAMRLHGPGEPLRLERLPVPAAGPGQIQLRVEACRVCRTDLHLIDGGYAEYTVADARYCFPLTFASAEVTALERAPLLCAGLIGYRALRLAGDTETVGIYGFGAAAHIIAQVLRHQGRRFYVFTRPGDVASQNFALSLGSAWVGSVDQAPPEALDSALIFAPAGALVPVALRHVGKGGCVVCAGIHMSDIPAFPYADLWGERMIRSVANLTRKDGLEFLDLAPKIPVRTSVTPFPLEQATEAFARLRRGGLQGAAVLRMD